MTMVVVFFSWWIGGGERGEEEGRGKELPAGISRGERQVIRWRSLSGLSKGWWVGSFDLVHDGRPFQTIP